ncbi:MAG: M20/M25/M40 family metallo-hydrolase [Bifidobacteriaceae bacterium]|jgi:acetylornithine deacetylase/succinyl-diaminopimelate desuccinylase-like protein|nr:M20/M25/M40 family metallo-hydrolase [Bifidobacteriaceae bacterium]
MITRDELTQRVADGFPDAINQLGSLVRIPSFAGPTAPQGALDRSAERVAELLQGVGASGVEIVRAGGGPGVIGQIGADPAARTVLLYAHHDVQPVAADWSTDPFEPQIKDGRLYGRGAADDAAGIVTHIGALAALGRDLPVNVRFFIEGEEESGSPTFGKLLTEHRAALAADIAVIADSENRATHIPSLTTSLRGIADLTVTLRVADHGVHSGMWGGAYLDAPTLVARLIATLHDADGAVAVGGLEPTGHSPDVLTEAELRRSAGLVPSLRLAGRGTLSDRVWWGPAITVTGFDATSVADASNTLQSEARARLSLRVPPGLDPRVAQTALRDHLVAHAPFGAELTIDLGASGQGFKADTSGIGYAAASRALTEAFGAPVEPLGQGGSIPLAPELSTVFPDMEVLITGVEDPASRAHAGDESVSLAMLRRTILAEALLLTYLGTPSVPPANAARR